MPKSPRPFWLYIVRCRDRSLYTGIAQDVVTRVARHNAGRGARYTASHQPVRLVYKEIVGSRSMAQRREAAVKRFTKARKEELVRSAKRSPQARSIRWNRRTLP